jgi:CRISPR-associated endonuclease/helicase Cas3
VGAREGAVTLPSFAAFFEAAHGHAPFPWQARLVSQVLEEGWPPLLDLPTGSGKTSALDIALYALAVAPEKMPRRILLVVDRRIVVDQGAEMARQLRRTLQKSEAPACVEIARRLRALWGGGEQDAPFAVAVMRGGMPRDNDWAKRPDQPVLGVSTIDQVGSRLLFRGYGISARSASIHAGLLGNDTLILLDEVHLATAFAETLQAIDARYRKPVDGLPRRFTVVQMSATPGAEKAAAPAFVLDSADRKHEVLKQRLGASKPARLEAIDVRGDNEAGKRAVIAERAVREAVQLQAEGAKVIGLVVNRVDTARLAWSLLAKHAEQTERLLVTGRMRPIDRDRLVQARLLPGAGADRRREEPRRPLVVVATQCIEAGADLDFDGLVTECASLDALRQRFGRLDRRGEVTKARGSAPAVILARADLTTGREEDPIYGEALAATWRWLQATAGKGTVDFGIDALGPRLPEGKELEELLARVTHAPVLLPAHLDAWAHTSPLLRPRPEPDPALWLHGPQRASMEVQVVWRAELLNERGEPREVDAAMEEELTLVRPSALEAMTLPLHVVRAWLNEQEDRRGMADVLAESEDEEARERRGSEPKRGRPYLLMGREPSRWQGFEREEKGDAGNARLRPGDLLLVPASYGGINEDGTFDPTATTPVEDLGDLAQLRGRGRPTLRMTAGALACWRLPDEVSSSAPKAADDEVASDTVTRIHAWAKRWPPEVPDGCAATRGEWSVLREELVARALKPKIFAGKSLAIAGPRRDRLLRELGADSEIGDAVSEDDDSSFRAVEVTLRDHSGDVQRWAEAFASRLGLSAKLAEDLALAGWLHDVGKADPRFQRWLGGGDEVRASMREEPLAKSALEPGNRAKRELALRRSGYPRGARHELLSLAMIERSEAALAKAHDHELVMHLVASHHGWCRPFAPALDEEDEQARVVELTHGGISLAANTRHRLAQLSSGVAQRFWALNERYGTWGLAWLEAVLRLADHRASEERESAKREKDGGEEVGS